MFMLLKSFLDNYYTCSSINLYKEQAWAPNTRLTSLYIIPKPQSSFSLAADVIHQGPSHKFNTELNSFATWHPVEADSQHRRCPRCHLDPKNWIMNCVSERVTLSCSWAVTEYYFLSTVSDLEFTFCEVNPCLGLAVPENKLRWQGNLRVVLQNLLSHLFPN